jgi:ferredoxin
MAHNLKVTIDPDRCVANGRCTVVAAGLFMIDQDTNTAYYEEDELADAPARTIFAAARACPTQAIVVEQFGRRVYPQVLSPMPAEIQRRLREQAAPDE